MVAPAPPPPPQAAQAQAHDEEIVVTGSRANHPLRLTAEDIARLNLPEDLRPLALSAEVCAVYAAASMGGEAHPADAEPHPAPPPHRSEPR
jgi:hypothetical protein